ncbi:hypothetical protein [Sporosarcina sp. 6E9]|uniref:hypothetical protein n=1 Tax=Sporosarcina sp. 6E9 TaxID=2819235 RepID=UPI001B3028DB|nr:hypothetical protein [Sporosarcina sp. 6E9]
MRDCADIMASGRNWADIIGRFARLGGHNERLRGHHGQREELGGDLLSLGGHNWPIREIERT